MFVLWLLGMVMYAKEVETKEEIEITWDKNKKIIKKKHYIIYITGHSLAVTKGRGRAFLLATMSIILGYFHSEKRKMKPEGLPGCSIPCLLIGYTQQCKTLVTALRSKLIWFQVKIFQGLYPFLSKKFKDFSHISPFSGTPLTIQCKKRLESTSFLVLPQHK